LQFKKNFAPAIQENLRSCNAKILCSCNSTKTLLLKYKKNFAPAIQEKTLLLQFNKSAPAIQEKLCSCNLTKPLLPRFKKNFAPAI
jgi:hypothetical protein